MQASQKLKTNNQYQENQADFLTKRYENQHPEFTPGSQSLISNSLILSNPDFLLT
jgi:hypothetical protein